MAERKEEAAARITDQFRSGESMVYDLSCCPGVRLTLSLKQRQNEEVADLWSAEAHARQAPERPTVIGSGPTRGDALAEVAKAWAAKNGAWGFPTLDWEAVARELRAVRAV